MDRDLQLTNEKDPIFQEYLWFLKDRLKISYLPIISLARISRGSLYYNLFPHDEVLQFYKTFYATDPNVANVFASKKMQMWLDIDIVTYLLWSCAMEMPLLKPIIANRPPNLNPMSQIWIYSNIVKDTIVNNEFKKLLAVGNISLQKTDKGQEHELSFKDPVFKRLGVSKLDEIDILIATKFGNPCPFADGPSTVQLRFEAEFFNS
jgi:hypothetical protein